jgi:hypothetical protein
MVRQSDIYTFVQNGALAINEKRKVWNSGAKLLHMALAHK